MVAAAFDFAVGYREIGPALSVLELFHGPSLSFKDFGVRFLAQVLARLGPSAGDADDADDADDGGGDAPCSPRPAATPAPRW